MIDLCFTPFSLVTAQQQQQSTTINNCQGQREELKKRENKLPVAGAGEIVDSVDANAPVETNGWIKTIVDIVCPPGTAKSCRTEEERAPFDW